MSSDCAVIFFRTPALIQYLPRYVCMYHSSRRSRVGTVVMKPMAGTVHVSGTCYILVPTLDDQATM